MKPFELVNLSLGVNDIDSFAANIEVFFAMHEPRYCEDDSGINLKLQRKWRMKGFTGDTAVIYDSWYFSFMDMIWLKIVDQLCHKNLGTDNILRFKEQMFTEAFSYEEKKAFKTYVLKESESATMAYLAAEGISRDDMLHVLDQVFSQSMLYHKLVLCAVLSRRPFSIVVGEDGSFTILDHLDDLSTAKGITEAMKLIGRQSSITINLQNILEEFYQDRRVERDINYSLVMVSEREQKTLEIIRAYKFNQILMKKGKGETLELHVTTIHKGDKSYNRFSELFNSDTDVSIKALGSKGNIKYFEKTEKFIL